MSAIAPHEFWQELYPAGSFATDPAEGYRDLYPATLPDGRQIALPIRVLPGTGSEAGDRAVASLIVNQASFAVEDALVAAMATIARGFAPDVIIGVPTLGLPLANGVARRLGHSRMIALGTSRKFWYRDDLSEPMTSITSPGKGKTIFLDPRMLPLLEGRRIVVVDDVVSSGTSMAAVLRLLAHAGLAPVGVVVAMQQTSRWRAALAGLLPDVDVVRGVFATPFLRRIDATRWTAEAG